MASQKKIIALATVAFALLDCVGVVLAVNKPMSAIIQLLEDSYEALMHPHKDWVSILHDGSDKGIIHNMKFFFIELRLKATTVSYTHLTLPTILLV